MTGDLTGHDDIRRQIGLEVKKFENKPWASRLAKFIAFAAIPAEVVGLLTENHYVGLYVASLGATCEWLSHLVCKTRAKSWLSLGRLPHFTH